MIRFHKKIHQVLPFKNAGGQCRCNYCSAENPKEQQRFGTNPRVSFCIKKVLRPQKIYIQTAAQNKGLTQAEQRGQGCRCKDSRNWMNPVFCHSSDQNDLQSSRGRLFCLCSRFLWQNKGAEKLRWQSMPGRCRSSVFIDAHFPKFPKFVASPLPWEVKLRNIIRHC